MLNRIYVWSLTGFLALIFTLTKVPSVYAQTRRWFYRTVLYQIENALYWLRTHTIHRYHIINLKGVDGYKWGWLETDDKILMATFTLLKEFVEKEDPKIGLKYSIPEEFWPNYDWPGGDHEHALIQDKIDRDKEIRALYNWWTIERPALRREIDNIEFAPNGGTSTICQETGRVMYSEPTWELHSVLEYKYESDEDKMLERLLKVRRALWT